MSNYGRLDPSPFRRVVGPSGRSTLLLMNAAPLKVQPTYSFLVIAVHPDDECFFVRFHVDAVSRHDARRRAREALREDRRDHWVIEGLTAVEYE